MKILNEHGHECPPARFDAAGRVINPQEAVGEIVNTPGPGFFEGYYKDEAATRARTRNGQFHTGDLGYMDADGFIYFAGRDAEWLRVGGENFLARPVEDILQRHPDVLLAACTGSRRRGGRPVMAAITLREGAVRRRGVRAPSSTGSPTCSPRWRPTFVRVARSRRSDTNKW